MVAESARTAVVLEASVAPFTGRDEGAGPAVARVTRPFVRLDRYARLNAAIALLTLADGVLESFLYEDFSLVGFSLMFVAPFLWFAWALRSAVPSDTKRWLRISGVTCLALAATCVISGLTAVTRTPVDIACVVMSVGFLGVFGFAAARQLGAAGE